MPVSAQSPLTSAVANGATTVFPFAFLVLQSNDLVVQVTDTLGVVTTKTIGADYTLSGVGSSLGGSVTFLAAPVNGSTVVIFRSSQLVRSTNYVDRGDLLALVLNSDFDRLWLSLQELVNGSRSTARSLQAPLSETLSLMPPASSRANKYLGFDAGGQPFLYTGTGNDSALRTDLATKTLGTVGSALVGHGGNLSYSAGTVGAAINQVMVNVKMYPWLAVGDGVADDTAAIQAALTAAGANGTVYFPVGTYRVTGTLTGYANQTLRGAGANSTIIKRTGDYGDTIVFGNSTTACGHVCIYDMWFAHGTGNYVKGVNSLPNLATSGAHVRLWGSQASIIRNVYLWRLPYQVVYEGGANGMLENCNLYGIWDPLYAATQEGVAQVLYRKTTIGGIPTSMKIHECVLAGDAANARSTTFTPNTGSVSRSITALVGSQYGVMINCMEDFEMAGCYSSGQSQNTVLVNNTSDPVLELRFYGNFFDCAGQAILQFASASGSNASYINVNGNTFNGEDTGLYAINFAAAGAAFGTHSSSVTNNNFFAFIGAPILAPGLYGSVISGNTISAYNDLNVTPSDPSYCAAVYVVSPSGNVAVSNNVVGYGTYCYLGIVIASGLTGVLQFDNINAGAVAFADQTPRIGSLTINMKKITGTTNAAQGATTSVPHGIAAPGKILGIHVQVFTSATASINEGYRASAGFEYCVNQDGTNVSINNVTANSANILAKPFVALITYEA